MRKMKIAALGDSLTKGVVLNERNRYSVLDKGFVDIVGEELDVDVKNYGKFGCTVGYGYSVIDRHSEDIAQADYTLLEYGGNDCDFDWDKIGDDPEGTYEPKLNRYTRRMCNSRVRYVIASKGRRVVK